MEKATAKTSTHTKGNINPNLKREQYRIENKKENTNIVPLNFESNPNKYGELLKKKQNQFQKSKGKNKHSYKGNSLGKYKEKSLAKH